MGIKIGSAEKRELLVASLNKGIVYAPTYDERRVDEQLVKKALMIRQPPTHSIATYEASSTGKAIGKALQEVYP